MITLTTCIVKGSVGEQERTPGVKPWPDAASASMEGRKNAAFRGIFGQGKEAWMHL